MAGLMLRTGATAGFSTSGGNYSPMTPASALSPTASIAQQAYGIDGSGSDSTQRKVAAYGSVGAGVVALAILAWIYWTLPL